MTISKWLTAIVLVYMCLPTIDTKADGEIFLKDVSSPSPLPPEPKFFGPYGDGGMFITATPPQGEPNVVYRRQLAHWKDVLTLPHSRMECVKWASGSWPWGGGWKTCIGWKTQFQWLWNTADLAVTTRNLTLQDAQSAANECLTTGAIAGAIAGIISGGPAAAETFAVVLKGCLEAKLATGLLNVSVPITSQWGEYE